MTATYPSHNPLSEGEISFARTMDMTRVREILTTPLVYSHARDDGTPAVEDFEVQDHPAIWYVLVQSGQVPMGMFVFVPENLVTWQVHTALLPEAKGNSVELLLAAFDWIWQNTGCRRIHARVPVFNRLALRLARQSGMIEFGYSPNSFIRHGELWDEVFLGVGKP